MALKVLNNENLIVRTDKRNTRNLISARQNRLSSTAASHEASRPHHGYHLVDPSPWPALTRLCLLWLTTSMVLVFHQYTGAPTVAAFAFLCLTYTASVWWRDVSREGVLGFHTGKVKAG